MQRIVLNFGPMDFRMTAVEIQFNLVHFMNPIQQLLDNNGKDSLS